jgi:hypothetical protein
LLLDVRSRPDHGPRMFEIRQDARSMEWSFGA